MLPISSITDVFKTENIRQLIFAHKAANNLIRLTEIFKTYGETEKLTRDLLFDGTSIWLTTANVIKLSVKLDIAHTNFEKRLHSFFWQCAETGMMYTSRIISSDIVSILAKFYQLNPSLEPSLGLCIEFISKMCQPSLIGDASMDTRSVVNLKNTYDKHGDLLDKNLVILIECERTFYRECGGKTLSLVDRDSSAPIVGTVGLIDIVESLSVRNGHKLLDKMYWLASCYMCRVNEMLLYAQPLSMC